MSILGNNAGHYGAFGPALSGGMNQFALQQETMRKRQLEQQKLLEAEQQKIARQGLLNMVDDPAQKAFAAAYPDEFAKVYGEGFKPDKPTPFERNMKAMNIPLDSPTAQNLFAGHANPAGYVPPTSTGDVPGLPQNRNVPWGNVMDPKEQDKAKVAFGKRADDFIESERERVKDLITSKADLQRFRYLNADPDGPDGPDERRNTTRPLYNLPGVGTVASWFDPELQEMKSIQDKLTPQMRQGLPGAASERDVALFASGTVGIGKDPVTNENIANARIAAAENAEAYVDFLERYRYEKGHVNGARIAWKEYLEDNPIFNPEAPEGSYELNPHRQTAAEYFSADAPPVGSPMSYEEWRAAGMPPR